MRSNIYNNNMSSVDQVSLVLEIVCLPYLLILYSTLACKTSGQPFDPLVKFILMQYLVVSLVKFVIFFLGLTRQDDNISYIISYACQSFIWCGFYWLVFTMHRVKLMLTTADPLNFEISLRRSRLTRNAIIMIQLVSLCMTTFTQLCDKFEYPWISHQQIALIRIINSCLSAPAQGYVIYMFVTLIKFFTKKALMRPEQGQRVRGLIAMTSIETLIATFNIINPIVARIIEIQKVEEDKNIEAYEDIIQCLFMPIAMLYEVTCFCYLVYVMSTRVSQGGARIIVGKVKSDQSYLSYTSAINRQSLTSEKSDRKKLLVKKFEPMDDQKDTEDFFLPKNTKL